MRAEKRFELISSSPTDYGFDVQFDNSILKVANRTARPTFREEEEVGFIAFINVLLVFKGHLIVGTS